MDTMPAADSDILQVRLSSGVLGEVKELRRNLKKHISKLNGLSSHDSPNCSDVAGVVYDALSQSSRTVQKLVNVDIVWPFPPWGVVAPPPGKVSRPKSQAAAKTCLQAVQLLDLNLSKIRSQCSLSTVAKYVHAHERAVVDLSSTLLSVFGIQERNK